MAMSASRPRPLVRAVIPDNRACCLARSIDSEIVISDDDATDEKPTLRDRGP